MVDRRIASAELQDLRDDPSRARGISKLSKLIRGKRHTLESHIPDSEIDFIWVVLTGREKQECLAGACARFEEIGIPKEMRTYTDLEDELTWQLISAAMRDPEERGDDLHPYPKPLGTPDEVRDALTVDERDILISEYMDLEEEVDPDPMMKSEQWHDDIEAALKKSPETAAGILSNFGSRTLIGYLLTTVRPRLISPIGNSESSSPETSNGSS